MNHEPDTLTLALPTQNPRGELQRNLPGPSDESMRGRGRDFEDFDITGAESLDEALARSLSSQTPSLLTLVERIAVAAKHDFTLLLSGETGTGKTFLARLIHQYFPASQPPVPGSSLRSHRQQSRRE